MASNMKEKLFNCLINDMIQDTVIVRERDIIRAKDHQVRLPKDQEELLSQIDEIYLNGGLEPPYFKDLGPDITEKGGRDLLEIMVKDETLIKVKEELYFRLINTKKH